VLDPSGARLLAAETGPVLGAGGPGLVHQQQAALPQGASVVLYTDGLVERRGEVLDQGLRRLVDLVDDAADLAPEALVQRIVTEMLTDGQSDDVALVVARHLPAPLHRHVPASSGELAGLRRAATAWALVAGLSEDSAYDLELTLGEAAANVVDHAYPDGGGTFDVSLESTGRGVRVTVADHGRWRPAPADPGTRGRGLPLIRTIGEHVDLTTDAGGTTIRFHVPATPDTRTSPHPHPLDHTAVNGLADGVDDRVQLILLTGDLDSATVQDVRNPLLARISASDNRPVEVDLAGLDYLSSSGIALLLEATELAKEHGRLLTVVAAPHGGPARILELSGIAHLTR
ncbi:ATP-binding protein, partial [Lentzea sp. NPDC006480]|uniref:ATP-binding protein n=1 Tax=Lentzea sp. NPDC006480 TaxID=3157176 RepID=UPI0033A5A738